MEQIENREYKSDVFSMLMEDPRYALEVYNVLNGSNIEDPSVVEIVTLARGISLSVRNDAAFIIDTDMSIYEHQSTYNPNMPLRSLIYFTEIIKSFLKERDLFSGHLIEIPTPQFVVFYNGVEKRPEYEEQKLSNAYKHDGKPSLELICKVFNINKGFNRDILSNCTVLREYMIFVDTVRDNVIKRVDNPIEEAINQCVEEHILEEFLQFRRNEVLKIMTIDMTFETREKLIRKEEQMYGRAEGRAMGLIEGRAEGRAEGLAKGQAEGRAEERLLLVQNAIKNGLSDEDIIRILGVDPSEVELAKSKMNEKG